MGASCYQSSDLAPHYGDMRSAATTGNRFIMIHCDANHDGDDYDDGGGDNRHDDTYSDNHDVMMMAMEMTIVHTMEMRCLTYK